MNSALHFIKRGLPAKRHAVRAMLLLAGVLAPTHDGWAQQTTSPRVQFSAPQSALPGGSSTPSSAGAYTIQPLPAASPGVSFSRSAGSPVPGPRVYVSPTRWQDTAPDAATDAGANPDGGANADPSGDASASDAEKSKTESPTLGEKPAETRTSPQFLRDESILLDPGEYQFEVSLQYLTDETDFVFIRTAGGLLQISEAQRRQRLLLLPLEFRLGLTPDTQLFVNLPFGWSNSEFDFIGDANFDNNGGIGDLSAGITKLLIDGEKGFPDVLTNFSFSAPTGHAEFATSLTTPGSSLGQGFWTITGGLTCIQTYDPIVVFYGFGYQYRFEGSFDTDLPQGDVTVAPGSIAFYRFGVGFAVNPRVTLSGQFSGSYIGENVVEGRRIGGSNREPMSVRLAATIVRDKKIKKSKRVETIEPFVNFGLTEGAIDSLIGVSMTR